MTRNQILNNWLEYNPRELADFIKKGVISLNDLIDECGIDAKTESDVKAELERELQQAMSVVLNTQDVTEIETFLSTYDASLDGGQKSLLKERIALLREQQERQRLEQIEEQMNGEWAMLRIRRDEAEIRAFRACYPEYSRMDEVNALLEQIHWEGIDQEWEQLRQSRPSERALEDFKRSHPDYPRIREVDALLNQLLNGLASIDELIDKIEATTNPRIVIQDIDEALTTGQISIDDLLGELRANPNLLSAGVLRELELRGRLSKSDLRQAYDPELIKVYNRDEPPVQFAFAAPISELQEPFSEIYFWGIPSSGKTCALGALLSTLDTVYDADCNWSAVQPLNQCQGFAYLNQLKTLFRGQDRYFVLPQSTPSGSIYEMSYHINSRDKKRTYPISFIDLAGELFRAMYLSDTGVSLSSQLEEGLQVLRNVFANNTKHSNRKVHFFVLEYGGHARLYDGLPQEVYLQSAMNWLENLGVFSQGTDAIYLLITKCDKLGDENMQSGLKTYLETEYGGFYRSLKMICEKYQINGKQLEVFPFSIGEVYMQSYCKFFPDYAIDVLNKILQHAAPGPIGDTNNFFGKLFGALNN